MSRWLAYVTLASLVAGPAPGQSHWVRTLGGEVQDRGEAVAVLPSGSLIGAGTTRSHSRDRDGWLFELDPTGRPGWETTLGGSGDDSFLGVTSIADGSLVAVGWRDDGGGPAPWLLGIEPDGAERWQVVMTGGPGRLEAVAPGAGGGAVAVGWFRAAGTDAELPLAIQVSSAGVVEWEGAAWPDGSWTSGRFESVHVDGSGRIRVGGRISPSSFGRAADGLLVELSGTGAVVGSSQLVAPLLLNRLLVTRDGGTIAFGQDGAVARLDPSDSVAWTLRTLAESGTVVSAAELSDGSLVLAGSGFSEQWFGGPDDVLHEDLVLMNVDEDGGLRWMRARGGPASDEAAAVAVTGSDDLVLIGTTTPYGQALDTEAWALKLDDTGQVSACGDLSPPRREDSPTFPLSLSPRPLTLAPSLLAAANPSGTRPIESFATTPCYDCAWDGHEPDDRCDSAVSRLHDGGSQLHDFCDDPEDWIVFQAAEGIRYDVTATAIGAASMPELEIWDAGCSGPLATGGGSLSWVGEGRGPRYLRVRQADRSAGPEREYRVELETTAPGCPTFGWMHERPGFDYAHAIGSAVLPLDDGGAVVLGEVQYGGSPGYDLLLTRLDSEGESLWWRRFSRPGFDLARQVLPTEDGGFLLVAEAQDENDDADAWVAKVDANGALEWQRLYGEPGAEESFVALIPEPGGGYLAAGQSGDPSPDAFARIWLSKLDDTGAIEWERAIGAGDEQQVLGLVRAPDGGSYLIGNAQSVDGLRPRDSFVIRLDADGDIVWQRAYGAAAGFYFVRTFLLEPDGGLLLAGSAWHGESWDVTLLKVNPAGSVESHVALVVPGTTQNPELLFSAPGGDRYLSWFDDFAFPATHRTHLSRLTPAGDVVWAHSWPYEVFQRHAGGAVAPDGRLFLVGVVDGFDPNVARMLFEAFDAGGGGGTSCLSLPSHSPPIEDVPTSARDMDLVPSSLTTAVGVGAALPGGPHVTLPQRPCPCDDERVVPSEVSAPGAADPLLVGATGRLTWEPGHLNDSETFDLYRGRLEQLGSPLGSCLQADLLAPEALDAEPPPAGSGWFYFVVGVASGGEGPAGHDSYGTERVRGLSCP